MKKLKLTAKKYTLQEIKDTWESYREAKGWRVQRNGEWELYMEHPDTSNATKAEFINIRHFMGFPKYLELLE